MALQFPEQETLFGSSVKNLAGPDRQRPATSGDSTTSTEVAFSKGEIEGRPLTIKAGRRHHTGVDEKDSWL
jgi:hypothetical protein